jgi:hypothetical protein
MVTVVVATSGGSSLRLGMPVDGGPTHDPEFGSKVGKIRDNRHSQTQPTPRPE